MKFDLHFKKIIGAFYDRENALNADALLDVAYALLDVAYALLDVADEHCCISSST